MRLLLWMTTLLFYRTRVLEADITGDTRQTSRFFQPNFGQQHAGSITAADDEDMFRVYLREEGLTRLNCLAIPVTEIRVRR